MNPENDKPAVLSARRSQTAITRSTVLRVLETHARNYRRTWRSSLFASFLSPLLYLGALGFGVGAMVDRHTGGNALGGAGYLAFLAPGLLAASAMQTAANEATYPVMGGLTWLRTYHSQVGTPLTAADVAFGQLLWIGVRVTLTCTTFVAVIAALGAARSPGVLLALPAAVLTGLALAGPIAAYTARLKSEYGLTSLMRFGILPMFLFSGTFYPVERLPGLLQPLAYATPLWHGVDLCRSLTLGSSPALSNLVHIAYLSLWAGAGAALTVRQFRKRLVF